MKRAATAVFGVLVLAALLAGCAVRRVAERPAMIADFDDTLYVYEGRLLDWAMARPTAGQRALSLLTGGCGTVSFGRPTDVDADPSGRIYVPDGDLAQVVRLEGAACTAAGVMIVHLPEFATPTGVEVFSGGVAVADAGRGRVFVISEGGLLTGELRAPQPWSRPGQMHWDGSRLFVCDAGRHRVEIFDGAGAHLEGFGSMGSGPGEFMHPVAVCTDPEGQGWVLDALNHGVQRFGPDLEFRSAFGVYDSAPGGLMFPKGLAFDSEGHLDVPDAGFHRVQVFSPGGALLYWFGEPGRAAGQFLLPVAVCIQDDRLLIADQYNRRVEIYRYLTAAGQGLASGTVGASVPHIVAGPAGALHELPRELGRPRAAKPDRQLPREPRLPRALGADHDHPRGRPAHAPPPLVVSGEGGSPSAAAGRTAPTARPVPARASSAIDRRHARQPAAASPRKTA